MLYEVFNKNRLRNSHQNLIAAIPIKHLLTALAAIVEWIEDGIYDFHKLPKAMKIPLSKEDKSKVLAIPKYYDEGK